MSDEKNNEGKSTSWAEKIEREAANEKSNQAHGLKREGIGDETGGSVKNLSELKKEAEVQKGKTAVEKYAKSKTPQPRLLEVKEKKQIAGDKKNLHLKSTTALTDPETAKQNLKDTSKAQNFGKEKLPSRGGFRGGGSPVMREPEEVIKEKHKTTNPEDILSQKKGGKPFEVANAQGKNQPEQKKQESQPQQAQHKSSFKASLDAKVQERVKKQEKVRTEKSVVETEIPKGGIKAEIAKKLEELKKSTAEKSATKGPKIEIAKLAPKPIIKGR